MTTRESTPSLEAAFSNAIGHFQRQEFRSCRKLLESLISDYRTPDAIHLLGLASYKDGMPAEARKYIREAISLNPGELTFYFNLAKVERLEANYAAEEDLLMQVISRSPASHQAHHELGLCLQWQKRYAESEQSLRRAIGLNPTSGKSWFYLGKAVVAQTSFCSAEFANTPKLVDGELRERLTEACKCFERGLTLGESSNSECYFLLGMLQQKLGDFEASVGNLRSGLTIDPQPSELPVELVLAYGVRELGDIEEAVRIYQRILEREPSNAEALLSLSAISFASGNLSDALRTAQRAVKASPDNYQAHANAAAALHLLGEFDSAENAFRNALSINPTDDSVRHNLALLQLYRGNFEEGWKNYESRLFLGPQLPSSGNRWNGEDLNGKTILVHAEQGLGDIIQFVRYIELLKSKYRCQVWFACNPKLHSLFSSVSCIDRLLSTDAECSSSDYWTPLLSVPYCLQNAAIDCPQNYNSFPRNVPYLCANDDLVTFWSSVLPRGLRVGIAWQGNPTFAADKFRSLPLKHFENLCVLDNLELVSLQRGFGSEQLEQWNGSQPIYIPEHSKPSFDVDAFADTAAIISQLDAVVSCDTSVAHLAGALGIPVYLLLDVVPDWRWTLGKSDSRWYPAHTLIYQRNRGDWKGAMADVINRLRTHDKNHVEQSAGDLTSPKLEQEKLSVLATSKLQNALKGAIGMKLQSQGEHSQAEQFYKKTLQETPGNVAVLQAYGLLEYEKGNLPEAIEQFEKAAAAGANGVWRNLAVCYTELGKYAEAWQAYATAESYDPACHTIKFNKAHLALMLGKIEEGQSLYESRIKAHAIFGPATPQVHEKLSGVPRWTGESLDGKKLLVHFEQGFGDCIQFCRFFKPLNDRWNTTIGVAGANKLRPLLSQLKEIAMWLPESADFSGFDYWLPSLSLPFVLGFRSKNSFRATEPYIQADEALSGKWRKQMENIPGFRIGIYWKGSESYRADKQRSFQIDLFEQLAKLEQVSLVSLQKGDDGDIERLKSRGLKVYSFGDALDANGAFLDTAAVVSNLDLVIGCDSAIGHLAGAIGKEVWLAIPFVPDWRWGLDEADTAWYSHTKLFRQKKRGDWKHPFDSMFNKLQERLNSCNKSGSTESQVRCSEYELNRATDLLRSQDVQAMKVGLDSLLEKYPHDERIIHFSGLADYRSGDVNSADRKLRQAIALDPKGLAYQTNLGKMLRESNQLEAAREVYENALRAFPDDATSLHGLGLVAQKSGNFDEAIELAARAWANAEGNQTNILNDLATSLELRGLKQNRESDLREALSYYRIALELNGENKLVLANCAGVCQHLGLSAEAASLYRKLLELDPAHSLARINLAMPLLASTNCETGWDYFENRLDHYSIWTPSENDKRWRGQDLTGKHLLLVAEQGLGDTIMFCRYADFLLTQYDCAVSIACQPALVPWVTQQKTFSNVVELGKVTCSYDYWELLMSLPARGCKSQILAPNAKRTIDPQLSQKWRKILGSDANLKVGVTWRGSTNYPFHHLRSFDVSNFLKLTNIPHIRLFSLQRDGDVELDEAGLTSKIQSFGQQLDQQAAFLDTAAIVDNLDYVIACDSAVAHLAASMEKTVMIPLSASSDWRWGKELDSNPWYPTARLYRQKELGNWDDVFSRIQSDLAQASLHLG